MSTSFEDMAILVKLLAADVAGCELALADLGPDNSETAQQIQFWRRAFIRAVFAYIEGSMYGIKQVVAECADMGLLTLLPSELYLLHEQDFSLNEKGEIKFVPAKLTLLPNIRFAFKMFEKLPWGAPHQPEFGDGGWEALRHGIKVRDRLMHPKHIQDLIVTSEEFDATDRGFKWFWSNVDEAFTKRSKADTE